MTEQIRPIGPRDRDVEPVLRLKRLDRDGGRERPDQREGEQPAERRPEPPPLPLTPTAGDDGAPHIDVRV